MPFASARSFSFDYSDYQPNRQSLFFVEMRVMEELLRVFPFSLRRGLFRL